MRGFLDDPDPSTEPVSEEQVAALQGRILKSGRKVATFCGSFGVETLDQLPATKYDAAISWLEHIERLDQYRADGLSHKEIEEIEHREIKRAMEEDPFFRRVNEHHRAGMDYGEAWNLTLAEELNKPGPRSQRLLECAAEALLAQYEPKLKAQWERDPARDLKVIDALTERQKANGCPNPRTRAWEMYAVGILGLKNPDALRRRHRRWRRRHRKG